jgi:hypothetical protein
VPENFHYHAFSYLDDWCQGDLRFTECMGFTEGTLPNPKAPECLVEAATYNQVIRNFKMLEEGQRLGSAWNALQRIEKPTSASDAVQKVEDLAKELQAIYGSHVISAASKFLWLRFNENSIIIYDSRAARWLSKMGDCLEGCSYEQYCLAWSISYQSHKATIAEACKDLCSIKKFTLASELPDEELSSLVSSNWFMERVFDRYLWFKGSPTWEAG